MVTLIEVEAKFSHRKAYKFSSREEEFNLTQFKEGQRVLPAQQFLSKNTVQYFFVKYHEPGTKGWVDGGFECRDSTSGFRAFHTDALIVHPSEIKAKIEFEVEVKLEPIEGEIFIPTFESEAKESNKPRKRGRPTKGFKPKKEITLVNGIPRKRGRPATDPSTHITKPYVKKEGGKRGRPAMDPALRKTKPYVPTGGKRGRKPKSK